MRELALPILRKALNAGSLILEYFTQQGLLCSMEQTSSTTLSEGIFDKRVTYGRLGSSCATAINLGLGLSC